MNNNLKNIKTSLSPGVIFMLAVGVILLVLSFRTEEPKRNAGILNTSMKYNNQSESYCSEETLKEEFYEKKLEEMLESMDEIGTAKVYISQDFEGVCVLCDGADKITVKQDIISACQSLFNIPAHRIQIYKLHEN